MISSHRPRPPGRPDRNNSRTVSRRSLLTASLAMPLYMPQGALGLGAQTPPSDRLAVAAVGIGGVGQHYIRGCGDTIELTALCDVDPGFAGPVFRRYPKAAQFQDFRIMFDKKAKDIEAVIIATPDHTHAMILMAALKLGKHIYCAKPIAHSIGEVRRIRKALLQAPAIVTKTSVQSSATEPARATAELLKSGIIGNIRTLHIWCNHPMYPCLLPRPKTPETPPAGMNWDLWIGPAPHRPYHSCYHPGNWRTWWDFGTGTVGDMTCHTLHVFFDMLKLEAPAFIHSACSHLFKGYFRQQVHTPECQSNANQVTWRYPARGGLPPLSMHWYDGGMKPVRPVELDDRLPMPANGLLFEGDKGKLLTGYSGGTPYGAGRGLAGGLLLPEKTFKDAAQPPKTLKRCPGPYHYREWVDACKTGRKTICPIELGCAMTEIGLLGALSLRTRQSIAWDSKAMKVTNRKEANRWVDPPYRAGWT